MSSNQLHNDDSVLEDLAPGVDRDLHTKHVRGTALLWLIMTVGGVLCGIYLTPRLMPHMFAKEGRDAVLTVQVFTVAAAPVAALVCSVALYSLLHTRHRMSLEHPPKDGKALRGNSLASGAWLVVSTLLVVFLLFWGLTEWSAQQVVHADALTVNVVGNQWVWNFEIPAQKVHLEGDKTIEITHPISMSQLNLPINVPVNFRVTSKDVTHGFWPVNLGIQVDANPGVTTLTHATPDRLGKFVVRCSQLCGLNHAYMYTEANIVSDSTFQAWIDGGATKPISTVTAKGAA
jgi:cytochrome c oxidase subunit 2